MNDRIYMKAARSCVCKSPKTLRQIDTRGLWLVLSFQPPCMGWNEYHNFLYSFLLARSKHGYIYKN